MMACAGRNPPAPPAGNPCTLRLVTLLNSSWVPQDAAEDRPDVSIRFAEDSVQQRVDGQVTAFSCVAGEAPERLTCSTPLDVLTWCQMRLASQRSCLLDEISADIGEVDAEMARQAILQAAEEHAVVAGTDQEKWFIERHAHSSEPLMRRLIVQPNPAQCQLQVLDIDIILVDGQWDEQPRGGGMAVYVPAPMP